MEDRIELCNCGHWLEEHKGACMTGCGCLEFTEETDPSILQEVCYQQADKGEIE